MLNQLQASIDKIVSLIPYRAVESRNKVKLIAHRGAHSNTVKENSVEAFDQALTLGAWGIELDIRQSKDGHLIVHHDSSLKRVWGVDKSIDQLTLVQIQQVSSQIPTLEQVVTKYGKKMHLLIELKSPFNNEKLLLDTLAPLKAGDDYHLLSLHEDIFSQLKQINPSNLCLVPELWNVNKFCQLSLTKHYGGVLGHYLLMTKRKQRALHQAGQIVGTGFVNSKPCLYREITRGVDWIFTDKLHQLI